MQSSSNPPIRLICLAVALAPLACAIAACARTPAIVQATQAPAQQPASLQALQQQALEEAQAGKADEAIRDFQHALELAPDWREGRWNLGALQYGGNHFAAARQTFQDVVGFAPTLGSAWGLLGLCDFETGNYADALAHLEKAQSLGIDDAEIARVSAYHLGLLLIRNSAFEPASALLLASFGAGSVSTQARIALGLALLRVPLLPRQLDPSREALVLAAGEAATAGADRPARLARLVSDNPALPWLHYAYGVALAAAGQEQQARQALLVETKLSPASPLPWIALSRLASVQPDRNPSSVSDSLQFAQRAVAIDPGDPDAHQALAQAFAAAGKPDQAAAERAIASENASKPAVPDQRMFQLYLNASGATTASAPQQDGQTQLKRALAEYAEGNYTAAIPDLKAALAAAPDNGTAWAMLGLSEFAIRDYDNALIHLDRGAKLGLNASADSLYLARYTFGILLVHAGDFDRAADILASASKATGALAAKIEFALGLVLLRRAEFPEAATPAQAQLITAAGRIESLFLQSQYDQAFQQVKPLLARNPSTPYLHYAYGTALVALSQFDQAAAQMQAEIAISPASELPLESLASIALRQHDAASSIRWSQRALQLAPDSVPAHYLLGRAYLESLNLPLAISELETATKLSPASPEVHFNLAKAYARAGMPEQAQQQREIFSRLHEEKDQSAGPADAAKSTGAQSQ